MDLVLLNNVARNPHIRALLDNSIINYPFKKLPYFYANQKLIIIFVRAIWFQSTPSVIIVSLTVCSTLPPGQLERFSYTSRLRISQPIHACCTKTSMVLRFKYLMKFRVQQLFILCSVINFVIKYSCVIVINEYRQIGVSSTKQFTKRNFWNVFAITNSANIHSVCHSLFFRRCKRCTSCIIYFLNPILSLLSSERT
jgi:hypothetical protein